MIFKEKKMVVFFLFVSSNLFLNSFGQNANISFESECHNVGDTLKLTAKYTGSGDPSLVQWYFSGVPAERFRLQTSNCGLFGSIPVGFPDANRLDYSCSLSENTYILEVTDLQAAEVNASWGATFTPPSSTVPAPVQEPIVECTTTTTSDCGCKSLDNCDISEGVCILLWFIIGILIAAVLIIVIILILHYCFDVKIPCCTCCKRKKTSSNEGEPPGTQNGEGQILHNQDTQNSAYYTNKRPLAKLEQLDEPESEKPHIGGRPLPQIGKHN